MKNSKNSEQIDYKLIKSFSKNYLETYYKTIDPDEAAVAEFLVEQYPKIGHSKTMLEIGCGPTIHHLIPAIPYVDTIDVADYLHENLFEVFKWSSSTKEAHNWSHFTKRILILEGIKKPKKSDINKRELQLKKRIRNFMYCNVLTDHPLGHVIQYSVIGFFYCAEEVTTNKQEWTRVIKRVTNMLSPGGHIFIAALRATHFYCIKRNGKKIKLPTAYITEDDFLELMPKIGFKLEDINIKVVKKLGQDDNGIDGIVLVSAKKANSSEKQR